MLWRMYLLEDSILCNPLVAPLWYSWVNAKPLICVPFLTSFIPICARIVSPAAAAGKNCSPFVAVCAWFDCGFVRWFIVNNRFSYISCRCVMIVAEDLRQEMRNMAAALKALKTEIQSSFWSSPVDSDAVQHMQSVPRPHRAHGRRSHKVAENSSKPSRYTIEWDSKMKECPENSSFIVRYSPFGNTFQLIRYQSKSAVRMSRQPRCN